MLRSFNFVWILASSAFAQVEWRTVQPLASPGSRYGHAMTYDAARRETVMFGGVRGTATLGDTWTYDGITWTQRTGSGPSPRSNHTMTYDALRQVVVMFGGYVVGASGPTNETWEWNGTSWTLRTPAVAPPPRGGAASAPFPPLGGVVIHGGYPADGSPHFWRWDGNAWQDLTTATTPHESRHALAYHPRLRRLVIHGRTHLSSWDGNAWLPGDRPLLGRQGGGLVHDSVRDRLVAFGGYADQTTSGPGGETWAWRGLWTSLDRLPRTRFFDRGDFGMAFDSTRGVAVVYGGTFISFGASATLGDTIELTAVTLPPPYVEPNLAGFALTTNCEHVGDGTFSLTNKPVLHSGGEFAWLGERFRIYSSGLGGTFAPAPTALIYGTSNQSWGGVSLPWPLAALGRPDCLLAVEPFLIAFSTATFYYAATLQIPNATSLVGTDHYFQLIGTSPLGRLFTSTGLHITIGRR
jgi:hypothetical protein